MLKPYAWLAWMTSWKPYDLFTRTQTVHSRSHLDDDNFMVYRKPTPNYNLGDGIGWFKGNTQGLRGLVLLLLL